MRTYNGFSMLLIFLFVILFSMILFLIKLIAMKVKRWDKNVFLYKYIFWVQAIAIFSFFQWNIAIIVWLITGILLLVIINKKLKTLSKEESIGLKTFINTFLATVICIIIMPLFFRLIEVPYLEKSNADYISVYFENALYITSIILFFYVVGLRPFAVSYSESFVSVEKEEKDKIGKIKKAVNRIIYIVLFVLTQAYYGIVYFLN
ncbi:MAG: hypothetical protein IKA72_00120 [Clostridia bacterium]|nr:hypothetical protein [Clostridia bacterium]